MRLDTDWSEIARTFDLAPDTALGDFAPRWNVAPTQRVPILQGRRGERRATWGSWGFVPLWERSVRPKTRPINAKSETVATSGMFRQAFRTQRCVVPATGFYEWETRPEGKFPFLFSRVDGGVLALAGIASRWRPDGADPVDTFCVLTTAPNIVTAKVHDRMPVVLPDARAVELWLDPDADVPRLLPLLRPAPDDLLVARPVARTVNTPAVDSPEGCAILA